MPAPTPAATSTNGGSGRTPRPGGKVIIPGIVSHATNVVEHPDLVADRMVRFAQLVGRENVSASTDRGLGGPIHPHIVFAKLESLGKRGRRDTARRWSIAAGRSAISQGLID